MNGGRPYPCYCPPSGGQCDEPYEHCDRPRPAVPAPVQGSDGLRDANNVAVEDVRAIAEALGIGGHARPYSAHEVVQREILPALRSLHAAEAAVQRVRDVLDRAAEEADANIESDHAIGMDEVVHRARRALGSQPTSGERTC